MLFPLLLAPCLGVSELTAPSRPPSGPVAEAPALAQSRAQAAPARPARVILGDVNGDGRQDALGLAVDGTVTLLRNEGDAGFQDMTEASGLGAVEFATCAALVDLDADGVLDLFLGSWSDRVWRNPGDGTFEPFRPGGQHGAVDLACNPLDADGDTLVAMNGRVYVKATAANGSIEKRPAHHRGLAGHCMKATDRTKAHGSVIGKAMSPLNSGEGLVLVLVTLQ